MSERSRQFPYNILRIVCAAIRNQTGHIICGPRHYDQIMREAIRTHSADWDDSEHVEHGFVDQDGTFYTRAEAGRLAQKVGQISSEKDAKSLSSEELY